MISPLLIQEIGYKKANDGSCMTN